MNSPSTQMATKNRSPVEVLRSVFAERKSKNPQYSLNAFARDLDISPSLVSRILNEERAISLKQGMHLAAVLNFNEEQTRLFVYSIIQNAEPTAKISIKLREKIKEQIERSDSSAPPSSAHPLYINYDIERFKVIAQWHHLAILNLTYVKDFQDKPSWIARKLGISTPEAKLALDRLLELGLLEKDSSGKIKKTNASFYFKTDRSELAMRTHQSQMINKSLEELQKTHDQDFDKRLINGITFPCAPKYVALLKKKIKEFHNEVLAMLPDEPGTYQDVYQLNTQLFSLTRNESKGRK